MNSKRFSRRDKKTIGKYMQWLNYETGLSGQGTTMLDRKPRVRLMPKERARIERKYGAELDNTREQVEDIKYDAYRQACINVLGEDPEDWGKDYVEPCKTACQMSCQTSCEHMAEGIG